MASYASFAEPNNTKDLISLQMKSDTGYPYTINDRYLLFSENLGGNGVRFTVLDKSSFKLTRTYSFNPNRLGYPNLYSDDNNSRYWLACYSSDNNSKAYFLDVMTGSFIEIPAITGQSSPSLTMSPSSGAFIYGTDGSYTIINRKSGKKIEKVQVPEQYSSGTIDVWNKNGDFAIYFKDNKLYILKESTMESKAVTGNSSSKISFLSWLPDGSSFLYIEDNCIKLYKTNFTTSVLSNSYVHMEDQYKSGNLQIQWNAVKNKAAIQDATNTLYIFDTAGSTCSKLNIPGMREAYPGYADLYWSSDGRNISCIAISGLYSRGGCDYGYMINNGNGFEATAFGGKSPAVYKNLVVFLSTVDDVNGGYEAHSIEIYSPKDKKLHEIKGICGYEFAPDGKNMIIYNDTDSQAYFLDENKFTRGKKITGLKSPFYMIDNNSNRNWLYCNGRRGLFDMQNGIYSIFDYKSMKLINIVTLKKGEASSSDWFMMSDSVTAVWAQKRNSIYYYNYKSGKHLYKDITEKVIPGTMSFQGSKDNYLYYSYNTKINNKTTCFRFCRTKL